MPSATFSYLPLRPVTADTSHRRWADAPRDRGFYSVEPGDRGTPVDALNFATVPKRRVFTFDEHRAGRPFFPSRADPVRPLTAGEPGRRGATTGGGCGYDEAGEDDSVFAHTAQDVVPAGDVRLQRAQQDARVWPGDPEAVAVEVFMSARHPYAAATGQERADERELRALIIQFLIARLDAENALALWDLGDRAAAESLSEAATLARMALALKRCSFTAKLS